MRRLSRRRLDDLQMPDLPRLRAPIELEDRKNADKIGPRKPVSAQRDRRPATVLVARNELKLTADGGRRGRQKKSTFSGCPEKVLFVFLG